LVLQIPIRLKSNKRFYILDTYKKLNYNVVIVQIRSAGDAMYPTNLAPGLKYGKQGLAPLPIL
jgi:uncharacterized lipoprotein YddW (UPF0748 family)